jgi:hypothetical protein
MIPVLRTFFVHIHDGKVLRFPIAPHQEGLVAIGIREFVPRLARA